MDRERAEVFAALASVADLSTLEQWQREKLRADARKAGLLTHPLSVARAVSRDKQFLKSWEGPHIPAEWMAIYYVHPWANRLINEILDSGEADVREFHKEMLRPFRWKLDKKTGRVLSEYDMAESAMKEPWIHLVRVILSAEFPFRRCALCKAIFVPASKKHKKYCTKECANKAVSLTPKRRKYMKDYMKDKRAAERS